LLDILLYFFRNQPNLSFTSFPDPDQAEKVFKRKFYLGLSHTLNDNKYLPIRYHQRITEEIVGNELILKNMIHIIDGKEGYGAEMIGLCRYISARQSEEIIDKLKEKSGNTMSMR
jgi:hypothetical protein